MSRQTTFCKHYRGMHEKETCEAGVNFKSFNLPINKMPCFKRGDEVCGGCDKQQFPTPEEEAEEERMIADRCANIGTARKAIVEACGGPWKKGMGGQGGKIKCPVCADGTLAFSRSGYNGHIHAACSTDGCVSWME